MGVSHQAQPRGLRGHSIAVASMCGSSSAGRVPIDSTLCMSRGQRARRGAAAVASTLATSCRQGFRSRKRARSGSCWGLSRTRTWRRREKSSQPSLLGRPAQRLATRWRLRDRAEKSCSTGPSTATLPRCRPAKRLAHRGSTSAPSEDTIHRGSRRAHVRLAQSGSTRDETATSFPFVRRSARCAARGTWKVRTTRE